ncbi:MAG: hypothetical protein R2867_40255 [Caldilineaceae bacterium]
MKSKLLNLALSLALLLHIIAAPAPVVAEDTPPDTNLTEEQFLPFVALQREETLTAAAASSDLADLLVLVDGSRPNEFDPYFCQLAPFMDYSVRVSVEQHASNICTVARWYGPVL